MKFLCILGFLVSQIITIPQYQGQTPLFSPDLRLISTADDQSAWLSESEIFSLYRKGQKFVDLTDGVFNSLPLLSPNLTPKPFPKAASQINKTKKLFGNISIERMNKFLTEFTSFKNRYYKSAFGRQSSEWLFKQLLKLSTRTDKEVKLVVTKFPHAFGQSSIIARLEPIETTETSIVILSSHQGKFRNNLDSVNMWNPYFGRSPGADDDGSGTTTVIEALTILIESGYKPKRTLEFHFYAAEEGGLLGSQRVVERYMKDKVDIYVVLHSDMTGYQPDGKTPVIAVAEDNVDKTLTGVLVMLTSVYSDISAVMTKCGDHASWTKAGVPSSFFFESRFEDHSPFIHSSDDTVAHIDFKHISEFVKVVLGFAVEMSEF